MEEGITFVALDTSKKVVKAAVLFPGREDPEIVTTSGEAAAIKKLVRRLQKRTPGEVRFCYEAGAGGYAIQRRIQPLGSCCEIVAPSLVPKKPGERIKTDRRDAIKLVFLYRAGMLTLVRPPSRAEEAARELCRARATLVSDRRRILQRVKGMLLRHGYEYSGSQAWTGPFHRWLSCLRWPNELEQVVFDDYLLCLEQHGERLKKLEVKLEEVSQQDPYRERAGWLRCFRGIDTVTAMTVLTEVHGIERFESAPDLMAYLGMVPSEYSSGEKTHRGSITKTGNVHVRRILVEVAHNYRRRASVRGALLKRREGQPDWVIAIADRAQQRLHRRFWQLFDKGKEPKKATMAVARELVGFLWAVLQGPQRPEATRGNSSEVAY